MKGCVDESWDEHGSRCLLNGEEGRNHDGKSSAEISGYHIGTIQREKAHPRLKTVDPRVAVSARTVPAFIGCARRLGLKQSPSQRMWNS